MNEPQQKFELYLDTQVTACRQRSKLLAEDDRVDESNFEKIRANVYEIFKAVLCAAAKACKEDEPAKRSFFLQKTEQIPASWAASYEKAKQNGDAGKMHIESIKLDTIRQIRDTYLQIMGGDL